MSRPPAPGTNTDLVFRALNHPVRRQIMERLTSEPGRTIVELTASLDMTRQSVKQHLDVLEDAGVLTHRWDGREKLHFVNAVPVVRILREWLDRFDQVAADGLLRLESDLADRGEAMHEPTTDRVRGRRRSEAS